MKKILILGCPGSGKSTFAKALHAKTGIALFHLDNLFWNADKTTVEREVFFARLSDVLQQDEWILDGHYASTLELRLRACDTVFLLDYPTDVCLEGVRARKGKTHSDLPWVETEDDEEFLQFIKDFSSECRPQAMALFAQHPDKTIHILKTHREADAFLQNL